MAPRHSELKGKVTRTEMNGTNGVGDSIRITRSTFALIVALSAPVTTVAVVGYQVRQHEAMLVDHEMRMRQLERAMSQIEQSNEQLRNQSQEIAELRKEIRELTRQLDMHDFK